MMWMRTCGEVCSVATQFKVFVRAPDSLDSRHKIYICINDPTQRLPKRKDSSKTKLKGSRSKTPNPFGVQITPVFSVSISSISPCAETDTPKDTNTISLV